LRRRTTNISFSRFFLRYLSIRYDKRRNELEQMVRDPGSPYYFENPEDANLILEDRDSYIAERVYVVPEQARWSYIVKNAKQPNIKEILDNAMKLIEDENPETGRGTAAHLSDDQSAQRKTWRR